MSNLSLDWIMSLVFSHSGKFLVSGSYDNSIKVFDLDTKSVQQHLKTIHEGKVLEIIDLRKLFPGAVRSVAISPNDEFIVSGSDDKSIKIFSLKENQILHSFQNAHKSILLSHQSLRIQYLQIE